jgi:hypothetical protein
MKYRANALLNPRVIFCAGVVLWAGRFWTFPAYMQRTFELGYYPPEGDTIELPMAGNAIFNLIIAPVFAMALWLLLRKSKPERRSWFSWHRERWALSSMWTVIFGVIALAALLPLGEDIRINLPFNALLDVAWFFFWLAMRGVVVSRISPRLQTVSTVTEPTVV